MSLQLLGEDKPWRKGWDKNLFHIFLNIYSLNVNHRMLKRELSICDCAYIYQLCSFSIMLLMHKDVHGPERELLLKMLLHLKCNRM